MPYANNKDADQPVHPCCLISVFVVRCLDSIMPILAKSKISRLLLVCVAEQAGQSLTWSKPPRSQVFSWRSSNIFVENCICLCNVKLSEKLITSKLSHTEFFCFSATKWCQYLEYINLYKHIITTVTWPGRLYHLEWMSSYHRITQNPKHLVWSDDVNSSTRRDTICQI